ncbi:PAAR domain-containing protein [Iodobacter arcticus]|uniref:PAAR domain-containing protein n=1 Tax=Iodobacter arcticus TaxID=590593 RepID=A0ABW2QUG0_9NEIS
MKKVIRLGDQTSHGGVVLSGASTTNMFGKPVALLGDKVSCPIPGHGVCPIIEGDPTWAVGGKAVALEGHKTSCGAVLISSMPEIGRAYEGSGAASAGKAATAAKTLVETAAAARVLKYDEQVRIKDLDNNPIPYVPYYITDSAGKAYKGISDAEGCCERIYTDDAQTLNILTGVLALEKW